MKNLTEWFEDLPYNHPDLPIVISCISLGISFVTLLLRIWMRIGNP